jgi:hypothetical protein
MQQGRFSKGIGLQKCVLSLVNVTGGGTSPTWEQLRNYNAALAKCGATEEDLEKFAKPEDFLLTRF